MSAETIKQFYNKHFFNNGQPVATDALITITINNEAVKFVGLSISPDDTIEELFKSYHKILLQTGSKEVLKEKDHPSPEVLNIITVDYRNNLYLLDILENEEFIVRQRDTNEIIDAGSPVAKEVIKRYQGN